MARIRSVHPSLFTDESWVSCSPLARVLYIGLWTDADDQGLFEWKPLQIKMRLLPGDAGDVAAMLAELEGVGLIQGYEVEGKRFGAIANFRKFQRPQKPNAIHPLPENIREYVGLSVTETKPITEQSDTSPVIAPQMEDGGEEDKNPPTPRGGRRKPKRPIPDGFPTAEAIAEQQAKARAAGANVDIANQAERFRNWSIGKDARYADWPATWRNWCDKAIREAPRTAVAAAAQRRGGDPNDRWRRWLREFTTNRYWPTDDAGPAPGRPGCRVPPEMLAEFHLSAAANDRQDLFGKGEAA